MISKNELILHVVAQVQRFLPEAKELTSHDFVAPPSADMGDAALPLFVLAKQFKKSPKELAKELAANIQSDEVIEKAVAEGPYLNISFQKQVWNKAVLFDFDAQKSTLVKKIMLEYSQPNTHKEFHVGHLRNVCLGAALVNLLRETGFSVTAVNYINDTGAHVAKCLWWYQKQYAHKEPADHKGRFLGKVYVEASRSEQKDPNAKAEISAMLKKLEAREPAMFSLWQKTRQWSLDEFSEIYRKLGVTFDHYYYDSELLDQGKKIVDMMFADGIAKKSDGAVLVDLSSYKLDVFLLQKSDGTALYQTKDLALAKKKFEDFDIDEAWYVVDARQSFYFQQLFKTLELIGMKQTFRHIPYEFVKLPTGAMSSREGNVILYEDLMDGLISEAVQQTRMRHDDWSEEEILAAADRIAHAAVKFWMLKHENSQVVTFDPKLAASFEGDTGPYVLYTYARIQTLLAKAQEKNIKAGEAADVSLLQEEQERRLLLLISRYQEMLSRASDTLKPSLLAMYALEICHAFNEYYHASVVIDEKNPSLSHARVLLSERTGILIHKLLTLLNISVIERM